MSPASDLVCFGWLLSYRNWVISDWVACGHSINEPCSQCSLGRDDCGWRVIADGSRHARFVTKMRPPPHPDSCMTEPQERHAACLSNDWVFKTSSKPSSCDTSRLEERHKSDDVWKTTTRLIWMHCHVNASIVLMEVRGGWMALLLLLTLVRVSRGL